jgi:hypothetical protein
LIDDASGRRFEEERKQGLGDGHDGEYVGLEGLAQRVEGVLARSVPSLLSGAPSVVHQEVEPAETLLDLGRGVLDRRRIGDIDQERLSIELLLAAWPRPSRHGVA